MTVASDSGFCQSSGMRRQTIPTVWLVAAFLVCCYSPRRAYGQTDSSSQEPQYTLHAYTNLIQVPVLVLRSGGDRVAQRISPERFSLSIDSGPWFRPAHVRPEGDDPLSLAILLDARGDASKLMEKIDDVIGSLAPGLLHPSDHVTVYGLDCDLLRSGDQLGANPLIVREQVDAVLQAWRTRMSKHGRCATATHLQDSMYHIISQLDNTSGRRVLVVVTQGEEETRIPWQTVALHAQIEGTAIFAITPSPGVQGGGPRREGAANADGLDRACQSSGGTLVFSDARQLPTTFANAIRMVRERYIVEFPRASNATTGRHNLVVRIEKSSALTRPAGASVPLPDPEILTDPTTVRSNPDSAPIQGNQPPPPD